jgi:hypothetical protein
MEHQPFKLENRKYFGNPEHPAHSPSCPFCGTGYVTAIGEATPHIGVCGDKDGFRQRYKCTKDWCRTEFAIVFRADFAENIVVLEDVLREWRDQMATASNDDFENGLVG